MLAAVMLCAGTSNQQEEAAAFVKAELAKHDEEVSTRLVDKMKGMVKMDNDGVWVSTMWEFLIVVGYEPDSICCCFAGGTTWETPCVH